MHERLYDVPTTPLGPELVVVQTGDDARGGTRLALREEEAKRRIWLVDKWRSGQATWPVDRALLRVFRAGKLFVFAGTFDEAPAETRAVEVRRDDDTARRAETYKEGWLVALPPEWGRQRLTVRWLNVLGDEVLTLTLDRPWEWAYTGPTFYGPAAQAPT